MADVGLSQIKAPTQFGTHALFYEEKFNETTGVGGRIFERGDIIPYNGTIPKEYDR